jgi:hypothetical protein
MKLLSREAAGCGWQEIGCGHNVWKPRKTFCAFWLPAGYWTHWTLRSLAESLWCFSPPHLATCPSLFSSYICCHVLKHECRCKPVFPTPAPFTHEKAHTLTTHRLDSRYLHTYPLPTSQMLAYTPNRHPALPATSPHFSHWKEPCALPSSYPICTFPTLPLEGMWCKTHGSLLDEMQ